jgi:hypothetical protein
MYDKISDGNNFIFTEKKPDIFEAGSGKEPDLIDDDEERLGEFDSDDEYEEFFSKSKLQHCQRVESKELRREEEKWVIRANWLGDQLQALLQD